MTDQTIAHAGINWNVVHAKESGETEELMLGFWAFLMSDAIIFGLLFATFGVMRHATAGAPGPHQVLGLRSAFIETMALLLSSFTMGLASLSLKYGRGLVPLVGWLCLTLALGLVFLGFEAHDFVSIIANGGSPTRSGYLSAYFALVPLHGLHVTAGSIWLVAILGQFARYGVDKHAKLALMRLSLFWHFLDIVWVGIFSVVYLSGLAQ